MPCIVSKFSDQLYQIHIPIERKCCKLSFSSCVIFWEFSLCSQNVLTVVETIKGAFGFWRPKRTSKKNIFIWLKRARRELSCDVVHLFIALGIIEISFDLYLSVGSESFEAYTITNNGKLFNE